MYVDKNKTVFSWKFIKKFQTADMLLRELDVCLCVWFFFGKKEKKAATLWVEI